MRAFYRDSDSVSDSVQISSCRILFLFINFIGEETRKFEDFFKMDKQIITIDNSEDDKNKATLPNLEMLPASSKDTESDLLQRHTISSQDFRKILFFNLF